MTRRTPFFLPALLLLPVGLTLTCLLALSGVGLTAAARACAVEPLCPGHEIFEAYEKGDTTRAQALLCREIQVNRQAVLEPITEGTHNIDVETRLGIGVTANVAAHALALHKKHAGETPVSKSVIAEIAELLGAMDKEFANAAKRIESNERIRQVAEYAVSQKKVLLTRTLDVMKRQGMSDELTRLLASQREFMKTQKIDPTPWMPKRPAKDGNDRP